MTETDGMATGIAAVAVGEHRVVDSDVDANGHMNLRRYTELAESAAASLFSQLGEGSAGCSVAGHPVAITEIITRQHREQFLGAHMKLLGGVVSVDPRGVTFHLELHAVGATDDLDQLASTHLLRVGLIDPQTRSALPLPSAVMTRAERQRAEVPATAQPRRLSRGRMRRVGYAEVTALDHEVWCDRIIDAADCDVHGWCTDGPTDLAWGPIGWERPPTLWQHRDTDGRAYGLANVEHRRVMLSPPRAGVHLQTVAVNVAVERNRRVRREWTFNVNSGELYAMGEFVDLVVDLDARRAVEIPDGFRVGLTRLLHPEFAHDANPDHNSDNNNNDNIDCEQHPGQPC